MNKIIGFIGGGNMANAMIGGILSSKLSDSNSIIVSDRSAESLDRLKEAYDVNVTEDNIFTATKSDILFLSVKPHLYASVLEEIKKSIQDYTILVSIAPGIPISYLENQFDKNVKIIRTMPNTPALVGEGMTALCNNSFVTDQELQDVTAILNSFGKTELLPESQMNAVVGVSGSSPAYVYMLIEAMADAAVADGIARNQAYTFAAQSVLGAAKMVLSTGKHPGELKDMVCSPGGTTIEAVSCLEKDGFRSSVINAQRTCVEKAERLGK